jgi:hypothetical protein
MSTYPLRSLVEGQGDLGPLPLGTVEEVLVERPSVGSDELHVGGSALVLAPAQRAAPPYRVLSWDGPFPRTRAAAGAHRRCAGTGSGWPATTSATGTRRAPGSGPRQGTGADRHRGDIGRRGPARGMQRLSGSLAASQDEGALERADQRVNGASGVGVRQPTADEVTAARVDPVCNHFGSHLAQLRHGIGDLTGDGPDRAQIRPAGVLQVLGSLDERGLLL